MNAAFNFARYDLLMVYRNLWVAISIILMALFSVVLTVAGSAPVGVLGVDRLTVTVTSLTTLSIYLVPLIALLLSFDAIAGERDRGILALNLSYPVSRASFLIGKFMAHFLTLSVAIGVGYGMAGIVSSLMGDTSVASWIALGYLYGSSLLLGATFLGFGYAISGLSRQPSAAAAMVIALWLAGIILYDLALLGALVADNGGTFTTTLFPWLLVINPADAFRMVNLANSDATLLASGLTTATDTLSPVLPQLSLVLWPPVALFIAWRLFRRIEP